MSKLISLLVIFGKLSGTLPPTQLQNPIRIFGRNCILPHPVLLICILPVVLNLIVMVDAYPTMFSPTMAWSVAGEDNQTLVTEILVSINFFTTFSQEIIFRLSALYTATKARNLIRKVLAFNPKILSDLTPDDGDVLKGKILTRSKSFIFSLLLVFCCTGAEVWGIVKFQLLEWQEVSSEIESMIFTNPQLQHVLYTVAVFLPHISAAYETLFVIIMGLELLNIHEQFCDDILIYFRIKQGLANDGRIVSMDGGDMFKKKAAMQKICIGKTAQEVDTEIPLLLKISTKFATLQELFDEYGYLAGFYSGIFISKATIKLLEIFCSFAIFSAEKQMASYQAFIRVTAILFFANFGHICHRQICRSNKKLEQYLKIVSVSTNVKENLDLFKWITGWKWKLSACGLCNINHSLIPKVASVVITYFVVILQLKLAEKPGKAATG